ncbi:hypothetical protein PANDA_001368 [Ailuropoda melanoleuca]|uniref:Voltage-dependent calcium channel alpha-2/delta subunit conserved region domain-containing protein n=1 Tax=Ailuropoda melanoleuca TaxID=9646 RepID=D2GWZ2_AILME|nr:hypothetical protein PANDA_001368 [Ailuropoda melanoleuca]
MAGGSWAPRPAGLAFPGCLARFARSVHISHLRLAENLSMALPFPQDGVQSTQIDKCASLDGKCSISCDDEPPSPDESTRILQGEQKMRKFSSMGHLEELLRATVNCYLIDNNGFILVSEDYTQPAPRPSRGQNTSTVVGKGLLDPKCPEDSPTVETGDFFGEVEGAVMNKLLTMGSFKRITLYDYQAMCRANKDSSDGASGLLDGPTLTRTPEMSLPILAVKWIMTELVLFLVEFNLCSWWHSDMTAKAQKLKQTLEPCDTEYPAFVSERTIKETSGNIACEDCSKQTQATVPLHNDVSLAAGPSWMEPLVKDGQEASKEDAEAEKTEKKAPSLEKPGEPAIPNPGYQREDRGQGHRSFVIQQIPSSNLFMVVVDSSCLCESVTPITMAPIEIRYILLCFKRCSPADFLTAFNLQEVRVKPKWQYLYQIKSHNLRRWNDKPPNPLTS